MSLKLSRSDARRREEEWGRRREEEWGRFLVAWVAVGFIEHTRTQ